jgi:hypothetical protein
MNEEFLHFIWKNRLFDNSCLISSDGEIIEILNIGQHNSDAGPDFFNAQVKINNTVWAGNVEIHLSSSDWYRHNHDKDLAYNNVILHVVENNDQVVTRQNGEKITTVRLKYDIGLLNKYENLVNQQLWIPCQNLIQKVDQFTIDYWLNSLLIERMDNKTKNIVANLNENKNDWQEVCYRQIARTFGYKINAEPFELLAKSLPYKYLAKQIDNPLSVESMIFGQAGLLNDDNEHDDYFMSLKNQYDFFKNKFKLVPVDRYLWKYLRLRPSNFPTIRLSQFANLVHKSKNFFSEITGSNNISEIFQLFNNISTSPYWDTHYVFGKKSPERKKTLGKSFINLIMINSVVPLLFIYGKLHDNEDIMNKALVFLEEIEPENNSIIQGWKDLGFNPANAFYSQALIELKNEYCARKNCLQCMIGSKIILRS